MAPDPVKLREVKLDAFLLARGRRCNSAESTRPFVEFAVRSIKATTFAGRLHAFPELARVVELTEQWLAGADTGRSFQDLFDSVLQVCNRAFGKYGAVVWPDRP
jgi:hypothetical protein